MSKYGNDWKKIQSCIGTRTCTQIRSHCQKYLEGLKSKAIEELAVKKKKSLFVVIRAYRNRTYASDGTLLIDGYYDCTSKKSNMEVKENTSQHNNSENGGDSEASKLPTAEDKIIRCPTSECLGFNAFPQVAGNESEAEQEKLFGDEQDLFVETICGKRKSASESFDVCEDDFPEPEGLLATKVKYDL